MCHLHKLINRDFMKYSFLLLNDLDLNNNKRQTYKSNEYTQ